MEWGAVFLFKIKIYKSNIVINRKNWENKNGSKFGRKELKVDTFNFKVTS